MPLSFVIEIGVSNLVKEILYDTRKLVLLVETFPHCSDIRQWGRYDTPRAGAFRLSLPIAFQSRYFSAVGTWDNPNNPEITDDTQNRIIAITATKTEIIIGRNGTGTLAVTYIIIGL